MSITPARGVHSFFSSDSSAGRISVENLGALIRIFPRIKSGENSQHLVRTQVSCIANAEQRFVLRV